TRNRTPRSRRAVKRRCSAGVSAKSTTAQSSSQTFGRRQFEAAQGVIDVAGIEFREGLGDVSGASPQLLGVLHPLLLVSRQNGRGVRALGRRRHAAIMRGQSRPLAHRAIELLRATEVRPSGGDTVNGSRPTSGAVTV